jgi:hypothetical protein
MLLAVLSLGGCAMASATQRASRELACPETQLTVVNRPDIDENVFDVSGCGRVARYMCFHANQTIYCAREPNPDPAEQAARRSATIATPPPTQPRLAPR